MAAAATGMDGPAAEMVVGLAVEGPTVGSSALAGGEEEGYTRGP